MKKIAIIMAMLLALLIILPSCGEEGPVVGDDWRVQRGYISKEVTDSKGTSKYLISLEEAGISIYYDKDTQENFAKITFPKNITDTKLAADEFYFADADKDGYADLFIPREKQGQNVYFYGYIYNSDTKEFDLFDMLNDYANLTVEQTMLVSTEITEGFGSYVTTLEWNGVTFTSTEAYLSNAEEIITAMGKIVYSLDNTIVELADDNEALGISGGTVSVDDTLCNVYTIKNADGAILANVAVSSDRQWYIDDGATGNYATVLYGNGKYSIGNAIEIPG